MNYTSLRGLPQWLSSKESTYNTGDTGSIPGLGRFAGGGHGNPLQSSCLENPMDRGAWWVRVNRIAKSQTGLKQLSMHAYFIENKKNKRYPPPRVMKIKTKINKWELIKNFCTANKTTIIMKRQPSEWEKIFVHEATDKGLISKIYRQVMQLNIKKTNNPIKKWVEDLNSPSSKEDIQMKQTHEKMLNIPSY